jgi:NitT/TauT family transport system substrate-binding protein
MRILRSAVFLLFVIVLLNGCSSRKKLLHLGLISPSTNHLPVLVALEEGLLTEENMKIHWFTSGWEVNEALVSGRIDLAIMPFTYAWQGVAENKRVRIISFLERESDGIIARKEISTIEELEGLKIGVLRASTLDIFLHLAIDIYGFSPEIVYFRTPTEMAVALNSGFVDALSFYVPAIFQFDERFHPIFWYSDIFPEHPCCDLIALEESLIGKKEAVQSFLAAMQESCQILATDREKGISLIVTHFGYDRDIARKTLRQQKFITGKEEEGKRFQELTIRKMQELGYIRKAPLSSEVYHDIPE